MIYYDGMLDSFFRKFWLVFGQLKKSIEAKEIILFLIFILTNFLFNRLLLQGVVIFLYIIALYLVNKNLTKSLWLVLISTIFFSLGRYFPFKFSTPFSEDVEAYKVFGVCFTDAVYILLLYWLKRSAQSIKMRISWADLIIGFIVFLAVVSSYFSPHSDIAWFNLLQLLKLIALFYLSRIIFWKKDYAKMTMIFMLIYLFLNSVLMILQKIHGGLLGLIVENYFMKYGNYAQDSPGLFRPGGMSWDSNFSAAYLSMGFVFLVTLLVYNSRFLNKKIIPFLLCLFAVAIIISASRGSWIAIILISFLIVAINLFQSKKKIDQYLKPKIIVPILLFVVFFGGFIVQRFYQFTSEMGQSTINTRLIHLKLGFFLSLNNPIGTGPDTFQYELMSTFKPKEYLFDSTPAHMMLGELLGDFGIFGTIAFISLFYLVLRKSLFYKKKNHQLQLAERSGFFYMIITYLFLAQIYPLLFSFQISAIFWIVLGALYEEA